MNKEDEIMGKFHINKHGVPAPCRARKGNCPLGGDDTHFDSEVEAQKHIDGLMEEDHSILPGLRNVTHLPKESLNDKFPQLSEQQIEVLQKNVELEKEIANKVIELEKTENKGSDEYWNEAQNLRKLALKQYELHGKIKNDVSQDDLDDLTKNDIPQEGLYPRLPSYHDKVEVTSDNIEEGLGPVITAYSGKSMDEVKQDIEQLSEDKGISYHDATLEHWRNMERRTDKPIISIDLETGNAMEKANNYDNGQLTYIIELGAIKTHPDGTVEKVNFLADVPKEHGERYGTGFIQAHGITLDDLQGKPEFSDPKVQKDMSEFLDNSVLIAQNAAFENKQLTHSLKGFRNKVDNGNIEFLDTHMFQKYLMPETEGNSNRHMVGAAGLEYEGAHRALNDAEMTRAAFEVTRKNR